MSVHYISDVLRHPDDYPYSGGKLVVLLILADAMNHEGACWPGIDRIAAMARCGRDTVFRALSQFEADGIIVREKDGRRNWYRWAKRVAECDGSQNAIGSASATSIGSASATLHREPSMEPSGSTAVQQKKQTTEHSRAATPDPKPERKVKTPKSGLGRVPKAFTEPHTVASPRKTRAQRIAESEAETMRLINSPELKAKIL